MPREEEMLPKDKYTIFDKKERKYRKGIHSKWSTGVLLYVTCGLGTQALFAIFEKALY